MKRRIYKIIDFLIKLLLPFVRSLKVNISVEEAEKGIGEVYGPKTLVDGKLDHLEVNEEMDLSIIVPVYNAEKLLKNCIDSIVSQKTKYNFEVIVINDGSTDSSLEILREYEKIKIVDKSNEGVAIARNIGLDQMKGKYVAFIDSDDEISENFVEKLLDRAYEKGADIVKCNFVEYAVDKKCVMKYERHEEVSITGKLGERITEFKGFVWGGIFKRELWQNVRFLPQYWYEDMIIRLILFRRCRQFEYINEDLYCYHNHSSNISKKISRTENVRCLDHLFLVKELLKMSDDLGLEKDVALYKVLLQELGTILWLRTRDLKEESRKYAFVLACEIMEKYRMECTLQGSEKYFQKSFEEMDFVLWKLVSIEVMLGVKIGNE